MAPQDSQYCSLCDYYKEGERDPLCLKSSSIDFVTGGSILLSCREVRGSKDCRFTQEDLLSRIADIEADIELEEEGIKEEVKTKKDCLRRIRITWLILVVPLLISLLLVDIFLHFSLIVGALCIFTFMYTRSRYIVYREFLFASERYFEGGQTVMAYDRFDHLEDMKDQLASLKRVHQVSVPEFERMKG